MTQGGGHNPIADALDNPMPAPTLAQLGDVGPELDRRERPPFPRGGPVRPLGISSGIDGTQRCYYLNSNGQLVGLEANNRHGKLGLIALYGQYSDFLEEHWPQWSAPQFEGRGDKKQMVKPPEIIGFDQAEAARSHIEACVRAGIFDPAGRMRGRGAHRLADGRGMVLHVGDKLLASQFRADGTIRGWQWHDVGLFEREVFTAAEALPRPWHEPVPVDMGMKLLRLLRTWNWKRPLLDPRFLLGWVGAAMIGGALPWRPNVWITGGAGTGKSSLNGEEGALAMLLGRGVMRTSNASAAAIRQTLKNSTVPVMFDEIEAGADNRRVMEVVELARIAASGGTIQRGGQDHQAHEFTLRSCFQFSSILIPPLEPQDRSRLGILELKPLADDREELDLPSWNLAVMGQQLQRRMIDGFARLEATRAKFRQALARTGHTARACDQFGTMLACADLLLEDWSTEGGLPSDEEVDEWAAKCRPDRIAEVSGGTADEVACLQHVTTTTRQARGHEERQAIGTWIGRLVDYHAAPLLNRTQEDGDRSMEKKLAETGLKLVNARWWPEERNARGEVTKQGRWGAQGFMAGEPGFLAVAWSHQELAAVFRDTKWQGGVWRQSLARCEGALDGVKVKFGHLSLSAVLVPLHFVFQEDEDADLSEQILPDASRKQRLLAWLAEQRAEGAV